MINFNKLIEITKALRSPSFTGRCFHTTFAFKKSKMLAIGVNKPNITHPINLKYKYTNRQGENISHEVGVHSEMTCFLRLGMDDCSDITFVNLRLDMRNNVSYSKPCQGCSHLFEMIGAKTIYFSNRQGDFEKLSCKKS